MVVRSSTGNNDKEVITLFTSPLWAVEQELPIGAYEWALDFRKKNPSDVVKSNRGGYQSPNTIIHYKNTGNDLVFDHTDGLPYYHHIRNSLNKIKGMENFIMTDWWLNINEKGDYNLPHQHPGAALSLIWYITHNEGLLKTDYTSDDLSYEKAAPTVGVGGPVRVFAEPPGGDSY